VSKKNFIEDLLLGALRPLLFYRIGGCIDARQQCRMAVFYWDSL
jgi:hypothetical protein